jgi:alpha-N-arabinofuranosidase
MTWNNPVIPGFYPDPSICRVGQDYFLVTSTFEYFPGVPVFHSKDLINWRQVGHCLSRPSQLPLKGAASSQGIYAPTIRHHNGRFYMVTTNCTHGGNFFVHTDDPFGQWSEPVRVDQKGIDPSLLFDDDGKVYLTTNRNQQSQIDIATGRLLIPVTRTWEGIGQGDMEAPHLYKINGLYYLMVAEGGTGLGHMVTIARSKSPWGPFESCPHNPILHNPATGHDILATGHADLVEAHDGSWWMVFLGIRIYPGKFPRFHCLGRETFLAPVIWDKDGWPVVNQNQVIQPVMEAPTLPLHPWPAEPSRDDFDSADFRLCWNWLRNPVVDNYSLTSRPGWLTLKGSAVTLDNLDSPTFLGRRQQHKKFTASALLDFKPVADNEEAGLAAYMNEVGHYEMALTLRKGQRTLIVRKRIADLVSVVASVSVSDTGPVELHIVADEEFYRFCYGPDKMELAKGYCRYISTEVAGGFTGVYIAMYSSGTTKPCAMPACFDYFDYTPA